MSTQALPCTFLRKIKYYSVLFSESNYAFMNLNMLKFRTVLLKHRKWLTDDPKPAQDGTTKALRKLMAHQGEP